MQHIWIIGLVLGASCALCWAGVDIARKHVADQTRASFALVGLMFAQVPFVLAMMTGTELGLRPAAHGPITDMVFVGFPSVSGAYLAYAGASVALNIFANWLFLRAMQVSPLSLATPYLAFTPVFSAIFAFLWLGQEVTWWGVGGIATVCLGALFLNPGTRADGPLAPLKALWNERGSLYMIVVAVVWSVTPILDRQAAVLTSPMWHTFFLALGTGLGFAVWLLARGQGAAMWQGLRHIKWLVLATGLFMVVALVLQLGAYEYIAIAYVETLKRALGVIGAMVAGYFLFGESDIARRFLGATVMVVGVALVMFGGH